MVARAEPLRCIGGQWAMSVCFRMVGQCTQQVVAAGGVPRPASAGRRAIPEPDAVDIGQAALLRNSLAGWL